MTPVQKNRSHNQLVQKQDERQAKIQAAARQSLLLISCAGIMMFRVFEPKFEKPEHKILLASILITAIYFTHLNQRVLMNLRR